MNKTKLGITTGLLAAAVCFVCFFSGVLAAVILTGYILIKEDDMWLKKTAVKAIAISIFFSIVVSVIGFIPNGISVIDDLFSLWGGNFSVSFISNLISLIDNALGIIEKFIFILMGILALAGDSFKIGFIDKFVEKHFA